MRIIDGYVLRKIADDWVAVPTGSAMESDPMIVSLNEVGVFIWRLIESGLDEKSIISRIVDEYVIDIDSVTADFIEFKTNLIKTE